MAFLFEHSTLGFCWWDLLALIALVAVIVLFIVSHKKAKEEQKQLEEAAAGLYAADTMEQSMDPQ